MWDSADFLDGPLGREPRLLRRIVELKSRPVAAVALVDVDDNHRLFVNGQLVGGKVGWQQPGRYDLVKFLKAGKNVIGIEGIDTGGQAGAICWIEVKMEDGGQQVVVTVWYTEAKDKN